MHLKHLFGCIDARKTYFAVFFTRSYGPLHEKNPQNVIKIQLMLRSAWSLNQFYQYLLSESRMFETSATHLGHSTDSY